jgi:hypothetical protein
MFTTVGWALAVLNYQLSVARDEDFGNAFLKLSTNGGLAVADYFAMDDEQQENNSDTTLAPAELCCCRP